MSCDREGQRGNWVFFPPPSLCHCFFFFCHKRACEPITIQRITPVAVMVPQPGDPKAGSQRVTFLTLLDLGISRRKSLLGQGWLPASQQTAGGRGPRGPGEDGRQVSGICGTGPASFHPNMNRG